MDEGYIKFNCNWKEEDCISPDMIHGLNVWRQNMYEAGLIGMYPDGIGFGNISMRVDDHAFIISGSATGGLACLDERHYARVEDCDVDSNSITCRGRIRASSESMTHAAVYAGRPDVHAVIHVHHKPLWLHGLKAWPTTAPDIAYGTPGMARAVEQLSKTAAVQRYGIMVMAGHEDGIISMGHTLEEAGMVLLQALKDLQMP